VRFRRWLSVLSLLGLLLLPAQSFGHAQQQTPATAPQTTQTDKSKAADKKQTAKPADARAIRTHPNRAITRTRRASGCNRLRKRARLQKARQRSAAMEATALAKAAGERVHIMVASGVGSPSSLR